MTALHTIILALTFNLFDFISGLVQAIKNKELKSSKMRDGLFKKIGFIFCYALFFMIDTYGVYVGLDLGVKVLPIIIAYSVLTECVSIIENISKINNDLLPEKLKERFK